MKSYSPIERHYSFTTRNGFESPELDYSRMEGTEEESMSLFETTREGDSFYTNSRDYEASRTSSGDTTSRIEERESQSSVSRADMSPSDDDGSTVERSREALYKHIIYGGLDGILTTFAIVSGGVGGNIGTRATLVLALSNIVADALNMGLGDALSAISHRKYVLAQYMNQKRKMIESRSSEKKRVTEIYAAKGLARRHARAIVDKLAKYDSLFVQTLMMEKLRLQPPAPDSEDDRGPWTDGFITFCSFGLWSFVPIIMYAAISPLLFPSASDFFHFQFACVVTMGVLFALGVAASHFSGKPRIRSGCEFSVMGAAVFVVAFVAASHVAATTRTHLPRFFEEAPSA